MKNRTGWQYALAGLFIACVAAVISYRDGLFVARLAGNHDDQAYLYPFLPDGLIVICLLALYEASRAKVDRSRWAMAGLVLGIMLTLAQNVYAGLAHSVLDAVIDGMVPVVFFIAAEVVLWHVRRGRKDVAGENLPTTTGAGILPGHPPVSVSVSLPGVREIQRRRKCSPTTAQKIRDEMKLLTRGHHLVPYEIPPRVVAPVLTAPAGAAKQESATPAGASPNGHRP